MVYQDVDRGRAWLILAVTFCNFAVIGGYMYGLGIVHAALLHEFQRSVSLTSVCSTLFLTLASLGGPIGSLLIDRWSCRTALVCGQLLMAIGLFCTAFVPSVEMAIVSYGALAGIGLAVFYFTINIIPGFSFIKYRNLAFGVAVSGIGVGMFTLCPLLELTRITYGYVGVFLFQSALSLQAIPFWLLCRPSALEFGRQRRLRMTKMTETGSMSIFNTKQYLHVLRNKSILCYGLCHLFYNAGIYSVFLHLPSFCIWNGFSEMESSWLLSVAGVATILSRVLSGVATTGQDFDEILMVSGSCGILGIGTVFLPFMSSNYSGLLVYSVILGIYFGVFYVLQTPISFRLAGTEDATTALNCVFVLGLIGTSTGPIIAGMLVDQTRKYEYSFTMSACCLLLASVGCAMSVIFTPKNGNDEMMTDQETTIHVDIPDVIKETESDQTSNPQNESDLMLEEISQANYIR